MLYSSNLTLVVMNEFVDFAPCSSLTGLVLEWNTKEVKTHEGLIPNEISLRSRYFALSKNCEGMSIVSHCAVDTSCTVELQLY